MLWTVPLHSSPDTVPLDASGSAVRIENILILSHDVVQLNVANDIGRSYYAIIDRQTNQDLPKENDIRI